MKKLISKKYIILICMLVFIDQFSKVLIINNIKNGSINIINNILRFTYVENTGIAFGLNSNNNLYNIIASVIIIVIVLRFMILQKDKLNAYANVILSLILSGGISNLIDRIFRGRVIDFIDFSQILNFPTFNIADSCVVVGWVLFVIYMCRYFTKTYNNVK